MADETDIFLREVDEDIRRERYQRLWDKYGTYVLAAAFLIIAGVGGAKYWQYSSAKQAAQAGEQFMAAVNFSQDKKPEETAKLLAGFVDNGPQGYRVLSRFRVAAETAKSGQTAAAVEAYDKIAADRDVSKVMQGYARISSAMLLMDTASWTEIENRLNNLVKVENTWRSAARELVGLAAYKAGKLDNAKEMFSAILISPNVAPGLRQRAEMMLGLLHSGRVANKTDNKAVAPDGDGKSSVPPN